MFDLRDLSKTQDQQLQRRMGSRSRDEFIAHMVHEAANPDQLEALAFQLLCIGRRIQHRELRRGWKDAWRAVGVQAERARARLAAIPTRTSHPALFDRRSVGKPGCLDDDLFLPRFFRLDMADDFNGNDFVPVGVYEASLRHGVVYEVRGSRLGETWVKTQDAEYGSKMRSNQLRRLQDLGRLVAVPCPAATIAKAA